MGQNCRANDVEFSQFTDSVACREYTLPRDERLTQPKGWIRGNTTIGPVLEVTTCCLQGKNGMEIRIESVTKDNSHSWGQNFSWLEKFGHKLEKPGPRRQRAGNLRNAVRRQCVKIECTCFCGPSKARAKPQRRIFASSSTKTVPIGERTWTYIEPQDYSPNDYPVSKQLITLLRRR